MSQVRLLYRPPAFARFASYGSARHKLLADSEASEGCRAPAQRAKAGYIARVAVQSVACSTSIFFEACNKPIDFTLA